MSLILGNAQARIYNTFIQRNAAIGYKDEAKYLYKILLSM